MQKLTTWLRQRATAAMLLMTEIEIEELERAAE
jgi:hypothetical protein